jgi:ABC-2 type transport system permease protein
MNGTNLIIFWETLRRQWRGMLYWGIGFALYGILSTGLIPDTAGLQQLISLLQAMPQGFISVFGINDMSILATPEGFVALRYFMYIVLVLAVYAVLNGLNLTANDEDAGIMDMILALPLPRWRVIVEKFAAYSVMMTVIALAGFGGLLAGMVINPTNTASLNVMRLLEGSLNMLPSALLILATTGLLATIVRRRATAAALAGAFVVVSYVLDVLGNSVQSDAGAALRSLSFIRYYDAMSMMRSGLVISSILILTAIALAALGASVALFQRRDIAV